MISRPMEIEANINPDLQNQGQMQEEIQMAGNAQLKEALIIALTTVEERYFIWEFIVLLFDS